MDFDIVVIGAGAVGLAIARQLSVNQSVVVLERNTSFGMETSSRSSEVIHAGIYYPADSIKSKLCVRGNQLIYKYCQDKNIPYRKSGKYIIAVDENESERLDALYRKAKNNQVDGISYADIDELKTQEPNIKFQRALFSKSTGIIDSHSFMYALTADIINNKADIIYNHSVKIIEKIDGGFNVKVETQDNLTFDITSKYVINSGGLNSDLIAESAGIDIDKAGYRIFYSKGHYFKLNNSSKYHFNHLIYPIPLLDSSCLGIHLTLDLNGAYRYGPDVLDLKERTKSYDVPEVLHSAFYEAIKLYLPDLEYDDISPDYAGLRPRLVNAGSLDKDFIIHEESDKNLAGLINLIGIESPGLTASLAIAEYVEIMINEKKNSPQRREDAKIFLSFRPPSRNPPDK
ncbi:MAG: NAD(P)/FAD-dependent oxidoreductase [bacterium]